MKKNDGLNKIFGVVFVVVAMILLSDPNTYEWVSGAFGKIFGGSPFFR